MTTTYRRGDAVRHRETGETGEVITGPDSIGLVIIGWEDGASQTLPAGDVYAMPDADTIDSVTAAYVACALWSSTDNADEFGGEPLDANYDADDLSPEAMTQARTDVADFLALVAGEGIDWQAAGWSPEQFGHDFWLTRNHHGAGFWDRFYAGPSATDATRRSAGIGDQLTRWAHAAGNADLYIGDDGQLYFD